MNFIWSNSLRRQEQYDRSQKGRNANRNQEIFFNPAATAEELHIQVDKFITAPPAGFSYPRGSAKA